MVVVDMGPEVAEPDELECEPEPEPESGADGLEAVKVAERAVGLETMLYVPAADGV